MARIKYVYDTNTCRYEREKRSWGEKSMRIGAFIITSLIMAFLVLIIRNTFFEPQEIRQLRAENEILEDHHQTIRGEFIHTSQVINALSERNNNIYRKIYEAEPMTDSSAYHTDDFSRVYKDFLSLGWDNADVVDETSARIEKIKQRSTHRSMHDVKRLLKEKNEMLAHLPAIQPVEKGKLASGFGMRINPFHKGRVMHFGIDFAIPRDTEVLATGSGKVVLVKDDTRLETGYGNYIEIDHGYGYRTRYAHLGKILVKSGQRVERGMAIARSGNSGGSIAPHVHYEVLKDSKQVDPINFLIQGLDDHQFKQLQDMARRENQALD